MYIASTDLETAWSLGGKVKRITGERKTKSGKVRKLGHRVSIAIELEEGSEEYSEALKKGIGFADYVLLRGSEKPEPVQGTLLAGKTYWVIDQNNLNGVSVPGITKLYEAKMGEDLRNLISACEQDSTIRIVGDPVLAVPGLRVGFTEDSLNGRFVLRTSLGFPNLSDIGEYEIVKTRVKRPKGSSGKQRSNKNSVSKMNTALKDLFGTEKVSF